MTQTQMQFTKDGRNLEHWRLTRPGVSSTINTTCHSGLLSLLSPRMLTVIPLALSLLFGTTWHPMCIANAAACGVTVINPFTSKLDCIGTAIPQTGTIGECLQIISLSPFTVGWATCGSTPSGDHMLFMAGGKIQFMNGANILFMN